MISISNASKSYPGKILFEDLSFTMSKGERLGLVGRNGCGKSTLIKAIVGELEFDTGEVVKPKGYKIGYLSQHLHFDKSSVLEECTSQLEIHEQYKAEKILMGLGFTLENMHHSPSSFSGGYQLRINLAKCILEEPNLLILDEPTNYLDLISLRWLSGFLKNYEGEIIIITHDQYFMDNLVTHTLGIYQHKGRKIAGHSKKYYEQIKMDLEVLEKSRANQDQKIKEMEKFVERFRAKASKATQAQSKQKALDKLKTDTVNFKEAFLGFRFNYKETPAKRLMSIKNLKFGYTPEQILYKDLTFNINSQDRIAIVGKNGKGKTTILRHIAQELKFDNDDIYNHPQTTIGFYHQTNKKDLQQSLTVADEIGGANPSLSISEVRGICGAVLFPGDDALKKIGVLSGGEQARVLLGKVLAKSCNLLLLDEPSNHLDIEAVEKLSQEIDAFKGPVLFVTHHEGMLHQLATKMIYFKEGEAHFFDGNYQEFLDQVGWEEGVQKVVKVKRTKEDSKQHQARRKALNRINNKIKKLENNITNTEEKIAELNTKVEASITKGEDVSELYKELSSHQQNIEKYFTELAAVEEERQSFESE